MEHPIATKAKPLNIRKSERFDCGAFYDLYRVIGDCSDGVPATDKIFPQEERENLRMAYRIIRAQMEREKPETISITQMIVEVDKFLRKEFKL